MGQYELCRASQPEHVHLDLLAGLLEGDLFESTVRPVTRVVDEHVDSAGFADDPSTVVLMESSSVRSRARMLTS